MSNMDLAASLLIDRIPPARGRAGMVAAVTMCGGTYIAVAESWT
jgi:hypothetical protein